MLISVSCQQDSDGDSYSIAAGDCDDRNPAIHPGAQEACNFLDDDCDGQKDEPGLQPFPPCYPDLDGDGYGDITHPCFLDVATENFVRSSTDCDDANADIAPSRPELCDDGIDNDCDGIQPDCGIYGEQTALDADGIFAGELMDAATTLALNISGDLNGDGRDDIVISAPATDDTIDGVFQVDMGRVFVVYSPALGVHPLTDVTDRINGIETYDTVGYSLASGFDLNDDGNDELLVGVVGYGAGILYKGGVFTYSGPVSGTFDYTQSASRFTGGQNTDELGCSVALGNVTGDERPDVVSGACTEIVGGQGFGGVYVLDGNATADTNTQQASVHISGMPESYMGTAVSVADDISGDGIPDLIVSAPHASTQGCYRGEVLIYYGPLNGDYLPAQADARLYGGHIGDTAGYSISTGDVNGDGVSDLVVGAQGSYVSCPQEYPDHMGQGFAYLLFGPVSGERYLSEADVIVEGTQNGGSLGWRVTLESDLDSDGHNGLVICAPWMDAPDDAPLAEAVYVFYDPVAGHHLSTEADATLWGSREIVQTRFGQNLAGGGDVNGDGYDDLLIGTMDGYPNSPGSAYLFLGGPRPTCSGCGGEVGILSTDDTNGHR